MDDHGRIAIPVGIAIGSIFVLLFILFCCLLFLRSKKRKSSDEIERPNSLAIQDHGEKTSDEVDRSVSLPIRVRGENTSKDLSNALPGSHHHRYHPFRDYTLTFGAFLTNWGRSMPELYHEQSLSSSSSSSSQDRITQFTYKELEKATKHFTTLIGKGAFGFVYKAVLPKSAVVAVKVLSTNSKQGEKEFQNEVMLLHRLHHKNLLRLLGYCIERGFRILVYEYMSNGSLDLKLHGGHNDILTWNQRVSIAQGVAKGIEYLHEGAVPPVIHRDIKSSNILLDSFMVAKVADFGLSKETNHNMPASGIKGTYGYVDPEYISTNSLTYKSDVYSFGVLLFELIAAKKPSQGLMDYVEMVWMGNGEKEEWLQILDPHLVGNCNLKEVIELALIATKCTDNEARKRPKMQDVCQALSRLGLRSLSSMTLDFLHAPLMQNQDVNRLDKGTMS